MDQDLQGNHAVAAMLLPAQRTDQSAFFATYAHQIEHLVFVRLHAASQVRYPGLPFLIYHPIIAFIIER